jgi:signal transduction histidine kinase
MSAGALSILGFGAVVCVLVTLLVLAAMRFVAAVRQVKASGSGAERENAMLSMALEDAIARLKTQEQATAERAAASEHLSEQIIASLASGLLVVGEDGAVRIVNPAARRLLRLADGPVTGNYQSIVDEPSLSQTIDECLATGRAIFRRPVQLPDGRSEATHLGVTVSPLFDGAHRLNGAVCLFADVTAVRQLEEQLRLKESLATVGELTAGIAHEFRNGLATIHGYSKLLDLETLPANMRPCVEGIRAEAISLGEVVTNFLNFARPVQLALSDVQLRTVCERVVDEARADARSRGGDVSIAGEFGEIQGDEVLLRQALSNLLRNALEACAGAAVTPMVRVEATVDPDRKTCTVTVDDNGPGVPAASRDRIFQPFFTSKGHGTGLGLALVQKIVVSHNGRVSVGTSPLGGARLQVVLPTD